MGLIARAMTAGGYLVLLLLVSIPLALLWRSSGNRHALLGLRLVWLVGLAALAVVWNPLLIVAAVLLFLPRAPWPARVTLPRRGDRRRTRIDLTALSGAWSRLMQEALSARSQFAEAVRRAPRGAIRERLAELTDEVDLAVAHAWERARRGAELDQAASEIAAAARSSNRSAQRWGRGWRPIAEDQRVIEARRARDAAAQRLARSIAEERAQLQVLVTRLTEAACHATDLSVVSIPAPGTDPSDQAATDLADRLTALRRALAEATSIRPAA